MYEYSSLPAAYLMSESRGWAKTASSTMVKLAPPQSRHIFSRSRERDRDTLLVRAGTMVSPVAALSDEKGIFKALSPLDDSRSHLVDVVVPMRSGCRGRSGRLLPLTRRHSAVATAPNLRTCRSGQRNSDSVSNRVSILRS